MGKLKQGFGIMPASMTIWNSDESYNEKEMLKYVRWLIDSGAHSISICGSTGENITMRMEEQKQIIKSVVKYIDGEVPVYPGTGRYSTLQTIELSKYAEEVGANGVMVILPFYLKPHKLAAMNHFRELRKHIGIDIMVYNNPWFAGYEFNANEVKTLVDEGVIGSIKAAQGDVDRIHDLKYTCGDSLKVFYGHDYNPMEALLAMADGWLSGLPAIFPKYCRTLFEICTVEKDVVKANKYWYKMKPFINYFYTYTTGYPHWQEIFKYVLKLQGFNAGLPRLPLGELDAVEKKKVEKIMNEIADVL
jgi:4-hydroxy-tetrahydrodipicolinate synthase